MRSDILAQETEIEDNIATEEPSNIKNIKHPEASYHGLVATSDVRAAEIAMVPSMEIPSVSSLFLALTALIFALSALGVGLYTSPRIHIKKKR